MEIFFQLPPDEEKLVSTDKGVFQKRSTKYIGILNACLADCNIKANDVGYRESALVKIVRKYNVCKTGNEGVLYNDKKPWTKINGIFYAGIDASRLSPGPYRYIISHDGSHFINNYSPTIGNSTFSYT